MSKQNQSKCEEVYVYGFVPNYLLPNKRPNSIDPFLHPLVEEIKDLFIDGNILLRYIYNNDNNNIPKHSIFYPGINVHYSGEVMGIEPGDALLRCLLLLWTGDYPAQSEIGKFVCNGIRPCRRCTLEGLLIVMLLLTQHYVIFSGQRNPSAQTTIMATLDTMFVIHGQQENLNYHFL